MVLISINALNICRSERKWIMTRQIIEREPWKIHEMEKWSIGRTAISRDFTDCEWIIECVNESQVATPIALHINSQQHIVNLHCIRWSVCVSWQWEIELILRLISNGDRFYAFDSVHRGSHAIANAPLISVIKFISILSKRKNPNKFFIATALMSFSLRRRPSRFEHEHVCTNGHFHCLNPQRRWKNTINACTLKRINCTISRFYRTSH